MKDTELSAFMTNSFSFVSKYLLKKILLLILKELKTKLYLHCNANFLA